MYDNTIRYKNNKYKIFCAVKAERDGNNYEETVQKFG